MLKWVTAFPLIMQHVFEHITALLLCQNSTLHGRMLQYPFTVVKKEVVTLQMYYIHVHI